MDPGPLLSFIPPHSPAFAVLVFALAVFLGLALGRLQVRGIGLGIAGVLFSGILLGHFRLTPEPAVLEFVKDFGLILFVYAIGMQVGPGFIASLRRQGLKLNALAVAIVLSGLFCAFGFGRLLGLPVPAVAGLLAGATTNTPSLAAAQQMLAGLAGSGIADPETLKLPALGYAAAYPFGIVGIILAMLVVRAVFRIDARAEAGLLARESGDERPRNRNIQVKRTEAGGLTVAEAQALAGPGVTISRLLRGAWRAAGAEGAAALDRVEVAGPESRILLGDIVHAVGPAGCLDRLQQELGEEAEIDLRKLGGDIVSRNVLVTASAAQGLALEELALECRHQVAVTRFTRAGVEFPRSPGVRLQYGDLVRVVGAEAQVAEAAKKLGNSLSRYNHPQLMPVFLGIALGVLLGMLPLKLPGLPVPVKLGLAGGPLLMALLLARVGRIGPFIWHLAPSANMLLREIGICLFLAAVGLRSGDRFVATLSGGNGLLWVGLGAAVTVAPLLFWGLFARHVLKLNYMSLCGVLAGSMTDPPALSFAQTLAGSEAPAMAYAAVYPLTMLLRVLTMQAAILLAL